MKDWFDALEARERLVLSGGVIFVVLALFYFSIWMPLDRQQATLSANVQALQQSIAELKPLKAALATSGASPAQIARVNQSLVVIIDLTLREHGLYNALQLSQPTINNGIRVEFQNASFDDLIVWLGNVGGQYGLQVVSGSFSVPAQGTEGWVNASLTLER